MTKKDKRLRKMRQNQRNVRFDDLVSVLQDYGFNIRQAKGSHVVAERTTDDGRVAMTIPKPHQGKFVKPAYIKRALEEIDKIIAEEEIEEEEDDNENDN